MYFINTINNDNNRTRTESCWALQKVQRSLLCYRGDADNNHSDNDNNCDDVDDEDNRKYFIL